MRRPALGRLPSGKVSPARISALARRHFVWALKSSQRRRLNEDGSCKASPRAAESLDASPEGPEGERQALHDRVGDIKADTFREVCARESLVTIAEAAADHGHETVAIVNGYIRGDSVEEIADATGLRENTVSVRKRRFVGRLKGAADDGMAAE
jgi:DNA-directed RNA polymerase specialized sigma24 family protein